MCPSNLIRGLHRWGVIRSRHLLWPHGSSRAFLRHTNWFFITQLEGTVRILAVTFPCLRCDGLCVGALGRAGFGARVHNDSVFNAQMQTFHYPAETFSAHFYVFGTHTAVVNVWTLYLLHGLVESQICPYNKLIFMKCFPLWFNYIQTHRS